MTHYRLPSSPLCVSTSLSSSVSALNSWIQIIRKHFSNGRVKPPPQASLPGLHCPVLENEWEDARSSRTVVDTVLKGLSVVFKGFVCLLVTLTETESLPCDQLISRA